MSDEVDRRHAIEKAAMKNVLNRSHVLAANIANELRNKRPEHFVDTLSTFTTRLSTLPMFSAR
jgi:hypothetical protein